MGEDKKKKPEQEQEEEDVQKELNEILSRLDESAAKDKPQQGAESEKPSGDTTDEVKEDFVTAEELFPADVPQSGGQEQEAFTTNIHVEGVEFVEEQGLLSRIMNVFVNPQKLFVYLKHKPDFWAPLVLTILISMISGYYIGPIAIDEQIQRIENNTRIPEEARMKMIDNLEASKTGTRRLIAVFVPPLISVPLFFLIIAFIFWAMGNFVFARQVRFGQMFAAVTYANLVPLLLGTVIKLPLIMATHSINVQTSLALFLSPEQQGTFLYSLLSSFDVFNLWYLAVLGIGVSVFYEVTRRRAFTLVFGLWFVWVIAKSAVSGFILKKLGAMGMGS